MLHDAFGILLACAVNGLWCSVSAVVKAAGVIYIDERLCHDEQSPAGALANLVALSLNHNAIGDAGLAAFGFADAIGLPPAGRCLRCGPCM